MLFAFAMIGTSAVVRDNVAQNIPLVGEARDSDIFIEAYRIPPISKNVVLAYKMDYMGEIMKYDWNINIAYAVIIAESGGNENAVNTKDFHKRANCYGSFGLFQIGCLHRLENWQDPSSNIAKAYEIYKSSGWKAWTTYSDGSYLKYL